MSNNREPPKRQPYWVPSFGMLLVIAAALLVLGCCGSVWVWLTALHRLGPGDYWVQHGQRSLYEGRLPVIPGTPAGSREH